MSMKMARIVIISYVLLTAAMIVGETSKRPASPAGTRRLISPCTAGVFCVEDWAGYLAFACRACAVERPAVPGALS